MAEFPNPANPPVIQKRPSQVLATSPTHQRPLPTPSGRKPVRSNPLPQGLVLRTPRITSDADWCQSVTSYLQSLVSSFQDTVNWLGSVNGWLGDIAWLLDTLGLNSWENSVVSWVSTVISELNSWIADIQSVISWVSKNGCGASWVQDFINDVESFASWVRSSVVPYVQSIINYIEGLL